MSDVNGDIEFDHVNFTYPARKGVSALRDLSIIARAGQTTALVGTSGSGKCICDTKIISSNRDFIDREEYMHLPASSPI